MDFNRFQWIHSEVGAAGCDADGCEVGAAGCDADGSEVGAVKFGLEKSGLVKFEVVEKSGLVKFGT